MTQPKVLAVFACLVGSGFVLGILIPLAPTAEAQPPKVGQKWEYGTLAYYEPDHEVGSGVSWAAGKKELGGKSEKFLHECLSKLNKDLGGMEEKSGIGVLLDRIGQNGWELVSYTRAVTQRGVTQTWIFKRPAL